MLADDIIPKIIYDTGAQLGHFAAGYFNQLSGVDIDEVVVGPCCTKHVKDSSRESSVVTGRHEQTYPYDLQDDELASL